MRITKRLRVLTGVAHCLGTAAGRFSRADHKISGRRRSGIRNVVQAALALAEEMTPTGSKVKAGTSDVLATHWSPAPIVELTAVTGPLTTPTVSSSHSKVL